MAKNQQAKPEKFAPGTLLAQGVYANITDKGGYDKKDRSGRVVGTLASVVAQRIQDNRILDDNGMLILRNMGVFNPPASLFFPSANADKDKQSPAQAEYLAYVESHPSAGVIVVNISIANPAQLELLTPFITDTPIAVSANIGDGI